MGALLRNRKGETITEAWKSIHSKFKKVDVSPETCVLGNELSKDLIEAFESELVQYKLFTYHKHKNNQAERALEPSKLILKHA